MANKVFWSKKLKKYVTIPLARWKQLKKLAAACLLFALPTAAQIVQSKACPRTPGLGEVSCQFDAPVKAGDLIVASHVSGTVVSDILGDAWKAAIAAPNFNGIWLDYALNAKGGVTNVIFSKNTLFAIIAEYPPSTGLGKASVGSYTFDNGALGAPNGGSYDTGWARPIETEEPCELLISWGISGSYDLTALHGTHFATAGPDFTMRQSEYGMLALEDRWAKTPGVYIGSMSWNTSGHWDQGLASFKMGGCH